MQKISYSYFHVFLEKDHHSFSVQGKNIMFSEKQISSFQIIQEKSYFEKTIFSEHLKKISYFHVFFWERPSFIFPPRGKIIFSGKRNIIVPGNTRKIIFQRSFFGKTIFSGRLEKENMIFRAVSTAKVQIVITWKFNIIISLHVIKPNLAWSRCLVYHVMNILVHDVIHLLYY